MTEVVLFGKIALEWNMRCLAKGGYYAGNPRDSAASTSDRKSFIRDTMHGRYLGFRLVRNVTVLEHAVGLDVSRAHGVSQ